MGCEKKSDKMRRDLLKYVLTAFILFLLFSPVIAQQRDYIEFDAEVIIDGGDANGAIVGISINGKEDRKISVPQSGHIVYRVKFNNQYTFTFSKEGYMPKVFIFSSTVPQEILKVNSNFPPIESQIILYQEIEGFDKSAALKPYAKIFYDPQIDDFTYEMFLNDMQFSDQVDFAQYQNEQAEKTEEKLDKLAQKELDDLKKEFEKIIKEADELLGQTQYEASLAKYKEAQRLFPDNPYPSDRIREIQNLLDALNLANSQKQENERLYKENIDNANSRYENEQYEDALGFYKTALELKPGDTFAQRKIDDIELLLSQANQKQRAANLISQAEQLFENKQYQEAIQKFRQAAELDETDPRPALRINEINSLLNELADQQKQEENYRNAITEGDRQMARGDFNAAIVSYRNAMAAKANDAIALNKIEEANKQIELARIDADYNSFIETADKAYRKKDYIEAQTAYQKAFELKPSDAYAKNKLDEITGIIAAENAQIEKDQQFANLVSSGDSLQNANNLEAAKTAYTRALELKPNDSATSRKLQQLNNELNRLAEEAAHQQQIDQSYAEALQKADLAFGQKNYQLAIDNYNSALRIKNEAYPTEQINLINQIIQQETDDAYNKAITEANDLFGKEEYEAAIVKYQEALQIKRDDRYADGQIRLANQRIREIAEEKVRKERIEADYQKLLAEAVSAFNQNDLEGERGKLQDALALKPGDEYASNRIQEIDSTIQARQQAMAEAERKKNEQYQSFIKQGDSLYNTQNLDASKLAFEKALQIYPDQAYPDKRIKQLDIEIRELAEAKAQQQQIDQSYNAAIQKGDLAFGNKDYEAAKQAYRNAARIKESENYPADQIAMIDQIIQQETDDAYNAFITEADQFFNENNFTAAINKYNQALGIKPDSDYPKNQIESANNKIIEYKEEQLRQEQIEKDYKALLADALKAFERNDLDGERSKLEEALALKPGDEYTSNRIAEIDSTIQSQKLAIEKAEQLKNERYQSIIKKADSLYLAKQLEDSKAAFAQALQIYPDQAYPDQRIKELDKEIRDLEREQAKQAKITSEYKDLIEKADLAFGNSEYTRAKELYNDALSIKEDETYPGEQIALINQLIEQKKDEAFNAKIAEADDLFNNKQYQASIPVYENALKIKTTDEYAVNQINIAKDSINAIDLRIEKQQRLESEYNRLISQANSAGARNDYEREKEKLQEALSLKPEDIYATGRIAQIEDILESQRKAAENERQYNEYIKTAQQAFNSDLLEQAKEAFKTAMTFKPGAQLPAVRINEIDQILKQRAEIARLEKLEEEQRIAAEKANQEKYDKLIADADAKLASKEYQEARSLYISAMSTIPNEKYPKDKVAEIDNILDELAMQSQIAKQKAIRDSIQNARQDQYKSLIAQAEELSDKNELELAIDKYNDAISVDPTDKAAINDKIKILRDRQKIIAEQKSQYQQIIHNADDAYTIGNYDKAKEFYIEASNLLPEEEYPKTQISNIQQIQEAQNKKYSELLAKADEYYNTEKWQAAKNAYIDVLAVKPNDNYASKQLNKVNQQIALLLAADMEKSINEKAYQDMLKQADDSMVEKKYTSAINLLEIAKTLKPEASYPDEKIAEITGMISNAKQDSLQEIQNNINNHYRQIISLADAAFRSKLYEEAKKQYQNALSIKPNEIYPQKQLEAVKQLMEHPIITEKTTESPIAGTYSSNSNKTVQSDSPTTEYLNTSPRYLENLSASETNSLYDETLQMADDAFSRSDYSVARFFYYKASDIKPKELYPKRKIEEIGALIDQELSAESRAKYNAHIQKADDAFGNSNYAVAKFYYNKALEIKSWERYPKDRIHEIKVLTNTLLSEREQQMYDEAIEQGDQAFYSKDFSIARFHYNKAMKINPEEQYPKIKLEDIKKEIVNEQENKVRQEYLSQLKQADDAFRTGNYAVARFYYNKALTILKNENYPKEQLRRIEEILNKRNN